MQFAVDMHHENKLFLHLHVRSIFAVLIWFPQKRTTVMTPALFSPASTWSRTHGLIALIPQLGQHLRRFNPGWLQKKKKKKDHVALKRKEKKEKKRCFHLTAFTFN